MHSRRRRLFLVLAVSALMFLLSVLTLSYMNRSLVQTRDHSSLKNLRVGSLLEWPSAGNETEAMKAEGQGSVDDASSSSEALQEKNLDEEPGSLSSDAGNISAADIQNEDRFQVASNSSSSYLVLYAAYFDDVRKPDRVTIVGIRSTEFTAASVVCSLSYEEADDEGEVIPFVNNTVGQIMDLPESQGKRYRAIYIFCPLPDETSRPDQVSVIAEKDPVANLLRISYPHEGPYLFKFCMCVSPVYGGYNIWQQTLESMEMARILGIDHVNIYVEEAGDNLKRVLQYYDDQGFLTVHSWRNIPGPIHDHGQLAIMHDCLLRLRYIAKYVIFMDLDEVIVPRLHDTLGDMVEDALKQAKDKGKDKDKVGAILVQNTFFHDSPAPKVSYNDTYLTANLPSDVFGKARRFNLKTVLMQFRGKVWRPVSRCKTIADPLQVDTMAVHFPKTMFNDSQVITVEAEVGMLHHYRRHWGNENTTRDTTAHKFAPLLVKRVEAVTKDLELEFPEDRKS